MIAAVIFDFDGVLADSEGVHFEAFRDTFAARGWTLDERAYYRDYLGYDDINVVRLYSEHFDLGLDESGVQAVVAEKGRLLAPRLESGQLLYPDASDCVARLRQRYRLGIASGSLRREITHVLEAGGLTGAFDVVIGADDVVRTKPDPEPYLAAAAALGLPADACVVIEDTRWGLAAARAAGMRAIALTTTSPRADLAAADLILDRLSEVTHELLSALG